MEEEVKKDKEMEELQDLLITTGILIPANELVHYMMRNESYMKLINSQQFLDSGISLEDVLDDIYISTKFEESKETVTMLRLLTEDIISKMHERTEELESAEDKQPLLSGLEEELK